MLHYIWGGMMLAAIVFGAFAGRLEGVATAAISGAGDGVTMVLSLLGVMCLWSGLMKIGEESGITGSFAKVLRPLTKWLFPALPPDSPALHAIVMNMTANLFGMSNAATPLGLVAMGELQKRNRSTIASHEMCMFVVINTASLQLIPTTILALRQGAGSANSFEIIAPVWMASMCALTVGVVAAKIFAKQEGLRG